MIMFATSRVTRFGLALAAVIALGIASADARPAGGGSIGSRGTKTFSAPPTTNTAPRTAQPIQRTDPAASQVRPGTSAAAPGGSRFGSGFGGLLMGGLLGAGLFGLLSGGGLFGGMQGLAGFMGLLLQMALIGGLIYLAMSFFRGRQTATAAGPSMMNRSAGSPNMQRASMSGGGFGGQPSTTPIQIGKPDYDAFEQILKHVQDAYGREDQVTLRNLITPEMLGYFGEEIDANRRKGVHNLTSDAKLLQGDLAEAWAEPGAEYATVAMRYSLLETTVERGTGKIVSGDSERPEEVTEVWTFARRPNSGAGGWKLSAIQQTN